MKSRLSFLLVLCVFIVSGCVVRSYPVTRERIDQDLSDGNRGYLAGEAPAAGERKPARTTRVVEFEFGSPFGAKKAPQTAVKAAKPLVTEEAQEEMVVKDTYEAVPSQAEDYESYTVQKGDTLQKISQKFFGTTKKWMKIYEANSDTLKGPNQIYPGQAIRIPVAVSQAPSGKIK